MLVGHGMFWVRHSHLTLITLVLYYCASIILSLPRNNTSFITKETKLQEATYNWIASMIRLSFTWSENILVFCLLPRIYSCIPVLCIYYDGISYRSSKPLKGYTSKKDFLWSPEPWVLQLLRNGVLTSRHGAPRCAKVSYFSCHCGKNDGRAEKSRAWGDKDALGGLSSVSSTHWGGLSSVSSTHTGLQRICGHWPPATCTHYT